MKEQTCPSCDYPTTQQICPECGDSQTEAYKREDERVMAHVRETIRTAPRIGHLGHETAPGHQRFQGECWCGVIEHDEREFIAEAIADEQEYESRQINSLIGTLVGLALLLSSVAFIAGFASAEKVNNLLAR